MRMPSRSVCAWWPRLAKTVARAAPSDPEGVVAKHERRPLVVGHRLAERDPGERLEIVLARGPGSEQDQHRRVLARLVPEPVDATLRHEQEVARPGVDPRTPVVQLDHPGDHEE